MSFRSVRIQRNGAAEFTVGAGRVPASVKIRECEVTIPSASESSRAMAFLAAVIATGNAGLEGMCEYSRRRL